MKAVIITAFPVSVGHGHLQHPWAEWESNPHLGYRAYFIPSLVSFEDFISLALGASPSFQLNADYSFDGDIDDDIASSFIHLLHHQYNIVV